MQKNGSTEYCLFPQMQRTIVIPFVGLPDRLYAAACSVWSGCRVKIAGWSALGIILGIVMCAVLYTVPVGYVVPRFYTDGKDQTSVYVESSDDPSYEGWKIMNYADSDTQMQLVQGKAITLETVRYYVGSALIGGLCGMAVGTLYLGSRHRNTDQPSGGKVKTVGEHE